MTIPSPPTFSSVRTEFNNAGLGIASNLNAYRRNAGIVPDSSRYSAIGTGAPGSPLQLSQFAGLTVGTVAFNNASLLTSGVYDTVNNEGFAQARYAINNTGYLLIDQDYSGYVQGAQWAFPTTVGSNYQVYAELISGEITGTFNQWLNTSASPYWALSTNVIGNLQSGISLQIREVGSSTILDTWTLDLAVELQA